MTAADASADTAAGVFDVEGVIVGDERQWKSASFRWLDAEPPSIAPAETDDANTYVLLLKPMIDRLTRSVHEAD